MGHGNSAAGARVNRGEVYFWPSSTALKSTVAFNTP
jgi:hypothetical protein